MFMLVRVKVHPGFLLGGGFVWYNHPTAALRSRGGLDEYRSVLVTAARVRFLLNPKGHGWAANGDWRLRRIKFYGRTFEYIDQGPHRPDQGPCERRSGFTRIL